MDRRIVLEVVAAGPGLLLVTFNAVATRRIWTSRELERSQQMAQTILVWLLPGAFLVVRYELDPPPEPPSDPTVSKLDDNFYGTSGSPLNH